MRHPETLQSSICTVSLEIIWSRVIGQPGVQGWSESLSRQEGDSERTVVEEDVRVTYVSPEVLLKVQRLHVLPHAPRHGK